MLLFQIPRRSHVLITIGNIHFDISITKSKHIMKLKFEMKGGDANNTTIILCTTKQQFEIRNYTKKIITMPLSRTFSIDIINNKQLYKLDFELSNNMLFNTVYVKQYELLEQKEGKSNVKRVC